MLWTNRVCACTVSNMTSAHRVCSDFPGWVCWKSDAGRYWATNPGRLTREQYQAGCAVTIDADTPDELWETLALQEKLRTQAGEQ